LFCKKKRLNTKQLNTKIEVKIEELEASINNNIKNKNKNNILFNLHSVLAK
jgi:hypothetical protein